MKSKLLTENGGKTFALVCDAGDEVIAVLTAFAKRERLAGSHFTGIGAFSDVVVGYFDWRRKDYDRIPIGEQVEVLSLAGDIALDGGEPKVHAHVVLGKADGTAHGGHLLEAHVRPTLEITLVETPEHLRRVYDAKSQLPLIDLGA
jgi:predicted DNA-binding protein with PD1-like motif